MGVFLSVCQEWLLEIEWLWSLRAELKERKDKESKVHGFGSVSQILGAVLSVSYKCWRQKLWDMFSGQQHIPLGVVPSDVSQTEYTTCLISSWTTSITWECERNFGCQNLLAFFQGSIPIKTWDNHNSESVLV